MRLCIYQKFPLYPVKRQFPILSQKNYSMIVSKIESRTTSAVDLGTPCRIRGPRGGRPSFDIPPSILEELRGLGFTWTCIAKMLNVSRSTISRRVAV